MLRLEFSLPLVAALIFFANISSAQTSGAILGVVVLHGKGSLPSGPISSLAAALEKNGYLVASPEMPWSARRQYDVAVEAAESELHIAADALRAKGASKMFVAGHSQGALFAIHYASKHPVDGVIAIAPGANVANPVYRSALGSSVEQARKLVAEGKGNEKTKFTDYEASRGTFSVNVAPTVYLSWFDPDGAMNQLKASRALNAQVPVLFVVPQNDYPGLLKVKHMMFDALPRNQLTRMYEPVSGHLDAPSASREAIIRWTAEVAGSVSERKTGRQNVRGRLGVASITP